MNGAMQTFYLKNSLSQTGTLLTVKALKALVQVSDRKPLEDQEGVLVYRDLDNMEKVWVRSHEGFQSKFICVEEWPGGLKVWSHKKAGGKYEAVATGRVIGCGGGHVLCDYQEVYAYKYNAGNWMVEDARTFRERFLTPTEMLNGISPEVATLEPHSRTNPVNMPSMRPFTVPESIVQAWERATQSATEAEHALRFPTKDHAADASHLLHCAWAARQHKRSWFEEAAKMPASVWKVGTCKWDDGVWKPKSTFEASPLYSSDSKRGRFKHVLTHLAIAA